MERISFIHNDHYGKYFFSISVKSEDKKYKSLRNHFAALSISDYIRLISAALRG